MKNIRKPGPSGFGFFPHKINVKKLNFNDGVLTL